MLRRKFLKTLLILQSTLFFNSMINFARASGSGASGGGGGASGGGGGASGGDGGASAASAPSAASSPSEPSGPELDVAQNIEELTTEELTENTQTAVDSITTELQNDGLQVIDENNLQDVLSSLNQ